LAELGKHATPSQIKPFVKERFGIEMTTDHISTAKGIILRKQAKGKKAARKAAPTAAAPTAPAQPAPQPRTEALKVPHAISLDDIRTVRDLVDRVGADSLRSLIDMVAR
jgi:hypothetical protein